MGCSRTPSKDDLSSGEETVDLDTPKAIYIAKSARLQIIDWFHVAR